MRCKYSICIPNYNYEKYVGTTIESVLRQDNENFEICIADNRSTDRSVEVIQAFADARIKLRINQWNVGFGGNLDKAAGLATGDRMIMVSSDDLLGEGALSTYTRILEAFAEPARDGIILVAAQEWIGADGRSIGVRGADRKMWQVAQPAPHLAGIAGAPVFVADPGALLKRSLETMRTPLTFLTTCYSRRLYEQVEGYGGNRLFGPDKWFAWKLLTVADTVVYVDRPLFKYRWHRENQMAQQRQSGALKHLVDQYVNTFDVSLDTLERAGVTRERVIAAFVEQDVALRNLERVADGERTLARRGVHFGIAAYPAQCRRNWKIWALRMLLGLGPLGTWIADSARGRMTGRWVAAEGADSPSELRAK